MNTFIQDNILQTDKR